MVTLLRYLQSWLFHSGNVQYLRKVRFSGHDIKDRPLFIAWGKENFGGDYCIFRITEGGSVITESPKGGIAECHMLI